MQLAHQCVCHMAGGGVAADQAVDEALQLLARLHQHALFLRVPFERDGPLAQHCRMPGPGEQNVAAPGALHAHIVPAHAPAARHPLMSGRLPAGLVCLREGIPMAAGPHQAFAAGDSLPDGNIINDWLQQAGLLTAQPDASLEAPSAAPGMQVRCCWSMLHAMRTQCAQAVTAPWSSSHYMGPAPNESKKTW
jgi:hypothetical protein